MENQSVSGVRIVSEEGGDMMTLESFGREGNRISVQGALMGAWSTKMYISPQDAVKLLGLMLNWRLVGYFISLPFILLQMKSREK